jgi:hypothetical protein
VVLGDDIDDIRALLSFALYVALAEAEADDELELELSSLISPAIFLPNK